MKADKVRELDSAELNKQAGDIPAQMFRLRFQMSMGQADGLTKLRNLKRDRARMLTVLRERALHPDTAPEPVSKKKGK
jgi:large subunit ribosomal protein L29